MEDEFYTLVTGASSGIGKAIAIEMASRGRNLILNALPEEGLSQVCSWLIEKYGVKVHYFETDLTSTDGPENLFIAIEKEGLKVDILVNNAGIGIEGPLESYTRKEIDTIIFLNVRALTLLTFCFTPELKKRPSYILNISSLGSMIPTAYKSVYLATKSYIYYFTRALKSEFKGTSVKTCVFIPGGVRTNEKVLKRMENTGWVAKASSLEPEEVAAIGIRGMFKGQATIVPGRLNKFIFAIGLFLPEGIIMAVLRNMFRRENSL
jgi:uncharacterized protein